VCVRAGCVSLVVPLCSQLTSGVLDLCNCEPLTICELFDCLVFVVHTLQDAKQEGYKYMNDSNNDATKMK
jgi:hypothetical protein